MKSTIDHLKNNFTYLLFKKIDPQQNMDRFYYLAWQRTLLGEGCIVRYYGRNGGQQHVLAPESYPNFDRAWPALRKIIQRRLRNGYQIVGKDGMTERDTRPHPQ